MYVCFYLPYVHAMEGKQIFLRTPLNENGNGRQERKLVNKEIYGFALRIYCSYQLVKQFIHQYWTMKITTEEEKSQV